MKRLNNGLPDCACVVAAAGSSVRMGGTDKIFTELCGVPVLLRTLRVFSACSFISEIAVVVRGDSVDRASELIKADGLSKVKFILAGGSERVSSVTIGVSALPKRTKYIAVHDGARPLVTADIIENTLRAALKYGAAACAVPVKDTVKTAKDGIVTSTPDRASLFAVQTPQIFDAQLLKAALFAAQEKGLAVTDDCMAVEAIGGTVALADGSYENIKITTPADLIFAGAVIKERES